MIKDRKKTALVYKGMEFTYADVLRHSLLYSKVFTEIGNEPKKIMVFSENTPEYVFTIYASLRINAIIVPIDVTSTEKELSYVINDCKPELILVTEDKKEFVENTLKVLNTEEYAPVLLTPSQINVTKVDEEPIIEIPMGEKHQIVAIIYTSGTTGSPKGVMLNYENFWYNIDAVCNLVPIYTENSRVILLLPLHHVFPFAGAVLGPLYAGGTIYMAESIAPDVILKTLQDGKITLIIGVPRLYDALAKGIMNKINSSLAAKMMYKLAKLIGSNTFSRMVFKSAHDKFGGNIKHFVSGGAALSKETGSIFKTLGFSVLEGFGMTECAPMISFTRPGDVKVGYCGKVLPGIEVKIGENEEVLIKGPNVMSGYYNKPEETAQIIKNGWLHSGDTGEFDKQGRLKITGRIKEIIVTSNGKNINPVEIEHALLAHTKVIKDVAVFLHEEILQAIIIPEMNVVRAETGKTIEECVKPEIEKYNESSMAYKRIMRFHITSQDLPKTKLGKTQRFKLSALIENTDKETIKEDLNGKSEIYLELKKIIDEETGKYANGDDHFEIDLALDSLARISLIAFISDNFNVTIKEEDMDALSTLNKLSLFVEKNASSSEHNDISWKKMFETATKPINMPKTSPIHWFMHNFIKIMFNLGYVYIIKNKRELPKGPCIFVANHRSGFDPVFITSSLRWRIVRNTFFFAKDKHFNSWMGRFLARRNNIILMDINTNLRDSIQQMYQVLLQGKKLVIFPEGTRSKNAQMKDFKNSFAILSKELNVPIIPFAITGSEAATYKNFRFPKFYSKIKVTYLETVYPQENESYNELKERVQKMISESIALGQ